MENKQENVEAKKSSTKRIVKYAAIAAAAVGLGYLLGNKETRNKIGSSINKLTAPKAVELEVEVETREEQQEASHGEQLQRPRKEWHSNNKGWRQERQFSSNQNQQSN